MNKEITNELSAMLTRLIQLVNNFEQDQFNIVPFEGSWTGGRVAQHLYLSMKDMPALLSTPGTQANRPVNQNVKAFEEIFGSTDQKFESPEFIFPEDKIYIKAQMESDLSKLKDTLLDVVTNADLNPIIPGFKFPGVGEITRLEAVWFLIYHTNRHNKQLKKVFDLTRG